MPGSYNLAIYRGDTYRWQFKLWADADKTQPVDLSGVTAKSELRDKSGGSVLAVLDCTITDPNIIDAVLDKEASALLPAKGVWDLQLTYGNGDVGTILAGSVAVTADVTDSAVLNAKSRRR